MNKKPVILIIENSIEATGALKSVVRSSLDLRDYFEFQFVLPKNSKARKWVEHMGFSAIHEMPMLEISRRISSILFYIPVLVINAFRLKRLVKQLQVSVIHVNDVYNLLPVAIRYLGVSTPYVCHIRFMPDRFPKILFDFWFKLHIKHAQKIVAVSQAVLKLLPVHPKVQVIYNELPLLLRHPAVIAKKDNSSFTFLYLSNFINGKGQDFAIDAFAKIHKEIPHWRLRFVGSDMGMKKNSDFRSELQSKARALGIFEKTEWVGFAVDVEEEYKQADVVLNFSESESFSITCLEALFYSRPLIATECGGPSEIIDNEETGLLVMNKNVDAMAAAMKRLAKDQSLRDQLHRKAGGIIKEKFSVSQTSGKLKKVYDSCLTGITN
jgi:glycosyltransferase involved in cell wall biosynthesis